MRLTSVLVSLLFVGCATNSHNAANEAARRRFETPRPVSSREAEIKQKSLQLTIGMPAEQVAAILGVPDKTEASTFGQALGKPWSGLVWYYGKLELVLEHTDAGGELNSWRWRY